MPLPVSQRLSSGLQRQPWWPGGWALWGNPRHLIAPVLIVETAAFALTALALIGGPSFLESIAVVGVLAVLAAAHTEIARGIERLRWRLREELHVDLSSTWIFAAVVLLSPGYAALTAIVVDAYATSRSSGRSRPLYRHVFSTATLVLAALTASAAMRYAAEVGGTTEAPPLGVLPIALGLLVFLAVNTSLVAGAIAISNPQAALASAVGEWDENVLEIASYCLGALAAAALVVDPWLIVLVFPPLLVLHRAVLVHQLEEKASTDGKTGLLNAAAWHNQAERELRRAERRAGPRAVLVVDLDHFKDVNDRHGHLAGDEVLAAVAAALRGEVRERDLVGRFGGEEFVVLLGALGSDEESPAELAAVAERIRSRIAALRVQMPTPDGPLTVGGLSASVGAALYPEHGRDVRSLLHVADTALYAAKRAGRNVVRMGTRTPTALPSAAVQVPAQAGEPTASH